ncbi:acetaldehyde dehydrogenase (acetylating) [Alkalihalobacillus oceani]|uniref:acetaldehyde dehydrogenase (acetylating) n=1 Tax=Halalkalibacter oceani TaxID=1653776 RepID=UPI0020423C27|nr:acetaldehyde dehydrogenase (acetylating) [Halalkalibacter oceani]MCM3762957.1 acetaldehyde dehydrogenase (acetylating) [Halalkalibacter oceani]
MEENRKVPCGIIGSGNIGTDLLEKLKRSKVLEPTVMIGIDPQSDGLQRAKQKGLTTIDNGIEGFKAQPDLADILFDATSAKAHIQNNKVLQELGKTVIDLTPAAIGPYVVPVINIDDHIAESNVNMVTCGGQSTVPIVSALNKVADVAYAEIVSTISSKSAGPGTRQNIDEFTQTTAKALEEVGGADKGKVIIILNPAEPPIMMRNTIHVMIKKYNEEIYEQIRTTVTNMVEQVQQYVPGYTLSAEPYFNEDRVTIFLQVTGLGDYLPEYAGNLDIMTSAAVRVGEEFGQRNDR